MKNIAIRLYLLCLKILSVCFHLLPLKKRIFLVATFPENAKAVLKEASSQNKEVICMYDPRLEASDFAGAVVRKQNNLKNKWYLLYYLNTSAVVLIDNYLPELAAVDFKTEAVCIQLWHANGALKQFGWEDKLAQTRPEKDKARFKKVYARFERVVVSSDEMAAIFKRSFLMKEEQILKIGMPRTDKFFDTALQAEERRYWREKWNLADEKVILYAPTFRDDSLEKAELALDIKQLEAAFGETHRLILKLHPSIQTELTIAEDPFLITVPKQTSLESILAATDMLITDYSSIPFEYALYKKPMYFFAYDLESYQKERGLIPDYETIVPGEIVQTTAELIRAMKRNTDLEKVEQFAKKWNKYSDGNATQRLLAFTETYLRKED